MKRILIALTAVAVTPIALICGVSFAFKEWAKDEIKQRREKYVK